MTMTQQILAKKSGRDSVSPGETVTAELDLYMANDITGVVAVNEYEKTGCDSLFNADKTVFVLDHFTPNKDIKSAENCRMLRAFAKTNGIKHFYEGGEAGIEHALLPEQGYVFPGDCIIGADSHTCTYGALNAFSTGVGSTDLTAALINGKAWFKVPEGVLLRLRGNFRKDVSGKDLILNIIGMFGVDGALYKSLEFTGNTEALGIDDKFTVCNMAIECGAKNAIFAPDSTIFDYVAALGKERSYTPVYPGDDADYSEVYEVDLSAILPTVACPSLPSNIKTVYELMQNPVSIDQVVIGSCTNGRISDLRIAAAIMKNKKIAPGVRVIIIPATPKIYRQALREGLFEIFAGAGCIISPPTCGPCLGGHMGILADGEKAAATTNRNFIGRMGHKNSEVYLCSPATAAYTAVNGYISTAIPQNQ